MRKRFLSLVVLGAALAMMQPASADYRYQFAVAQAAVFEGKLYGGGTAKGFLGRLEGIDGGGQIQVLPAPLEQDAPGQSAYYIGCLTIKTPQGRDGGCTLVPPSTVNFDPLMEKGSVTLAVKSRIAGRKVIANLFMDGTGTGPGAPSPSCKDTSGKPCNRTNPVTNTSPHKIGTGGATVPIWPNLVSLDAQQVLARDMAVLGSVRSDVVGGGAISSTSVSRVYSGINGNIKYTDACLVTLTFCRT